MACWLNQMADRNSPKSNGFPSCRPACARVLLEEAHEHEAAAGRNSRQPGGQMNSRSAVAAGCGQRQAAWRRRWLGGGWVGRHRGPGLPPPEAILDLKIPAARPPRWSRPRWQSRLPTPAETAGDVKIPGQGYASGWVEHVKLSNISTFHYYKPGRAFPVPADLPVDCQTPRGRGRWGSFCTRAGVKSAITSEAKVSVIRQSISSLQVV